MDFSADFHARPQDIVGKTRPRAALKSCWKSREELSMT